MVFEPAPRQKRCSANTSITGLSSTGPTIRSPDGGLRVVGAESLNLARHKKLVESNPQKINKCKSKNSKNSMPAKAQMTVATERSLWKGHGLTRATANEGEHHASKARLNELGDSLESSGDHNADHEERYCTEDFAEKGTEVPEVEGEDEMQQRKRKGAAFLNRRTNVYSLRI